MKAIDTLQYESKTFTVSVQTMPENESKGYVSYFIDGLEITDWKQLVKRYQRIFDAMADNICEKWTLQKWSY